MKKFIALYGEFVISVIVLMVFFTLLPYIVMTYMLNFWLVFGVGILVVLFFNFIAGKRLKIRADAYARKQENFKKSKRS